MVNIKELSRDLALDATSKPDVVIAEVETWSAEGALPKELCEGIESVKEKVTALARQEGRPLSEHEKLVLASAYIETIAAK